MNSEIKKILVLSPHTDDGEFGCGGTIHRLIREGHEVHYVAFSDCEDSVPEGFDKKILRKEMFKATEVLGFKNEKVKILDYQVRYFFRDRQKILEDLVLMNRSIQPDIVFIPCIDDIHQDHSTISKEALRAFKRCTIYGYELPWNLMSLPSTMFYELAKEDIAAKLEAISKYKSQQGRGYSDDQYIRALAITRGKRIFIEYAEVFEVIRQINRL